jgi:hypothetical protein
MPVAFSCGISFNQPVNRSIVPAEPCHVAAGKRTRLSILSEALLLPWLHRQAM